jgi:hypothetical protein
MIIRLNIRDRDDKHVLEVAHHVPETGNAHILENVELPATANAAAYNPARIHIEIEREPVEPQRRTLMLVWSCDKSIFQDVLQFRTVHTDNIHAEIEEQLALFEDQVHVHTGRDCCRVKVWQLAYDNRVYSGRQT